MILRDFHWVLEGMLAGASQPGLFQPMEKDLEVLTGLGIAFIVTLTETPLDPAPETFGLRGLHFPIDDMSIPSPRAAREVCQIVNQALRERSEPVLMHCKAGLGRTGTMLACYLISQEGLSAEDALQRLRRINRHFVQSTAQENFLTHYEEYVRPTPGLETGAPRPEMKLKLRLPNCD